MNAASDGYVIDLRFHAYSYLTLLCPSGEGYLNSGQRAYQQTGWAGWTNQVLSCVVGVESVSKGGLVSILDFPFIAPDHLMILLTSVLCTTQATKPRINPFRMSTSSGLGKYGETVERATSPGNRQEPEQRHIGKTSLLGNIGHNSNTNAKMLTGSMIKMLAGLVTIWFRSAVNRPVIGSFGIRIPFVSLLFTLV